MTIQASTFKNLTVCAIAATLLSACATESQMTAEAQARSDKAVVDLERQPRCCESFDEIRYVSLSGERTSIELQPEAAPVRTFESGPSYFLAVAVPQGAGPTAIGIRSDLLNGGRGEIPTVFVPSMIKLSSDFKQIGAVQELALTFRRGWSRQDVGYFSTLRIEDPQVRYLIFFTNQARFGNHVPYRSSATTAGGNAVVDVNIDYRLPRSPNGHLDVWLEHSVTGS